MKLEDIEKLVRLVAETGVAELDVSRAGVHVRVVRQVREAAPSVQFLPMPGGGGWPQASPESGLAAPPAAAALPPPPRAAEDEEGIHVIKASMVGTFYRRPNPQSQPFVKEGDTVRKGQVVCILEAMKILNEIESDADGTVVRIHVEDSQPVEYGEKLISIRPG